MELSEQSHLIKSYFETVGYQRFLRIYQAQCQSVFQRYVRDGHRETTDTVLSWIAEPRGIEQISVCDAGCGVGTLSLPLARAGAVVHGVDFSGQMIAAARRNARLAKCGQRTPSFEVEDMMNLRGPYHTVTCIDVLPRYSGPQAIQLLDHLSGLATHRLIVSFTPKTWLDPLLLMLGNSVAKRRKAPLLYTHDNESIVKSLAARGWAITRQKTVSAPFKIYYCHVLELHKNSAHASALAESRDDNADKTHLFRCPFSRPMVG